MIAIIPAKSKSERLKGKNFKPLNGKPLFEWTVLAALDSFVFDRIIISSDVNPGIFMHSFLEWDKRSEELCANEATTVDVCKHILHKHPHNEFMLLLPTSPLRTCEQIREAYSILQRSKADCVMSVAEYPPKEYLMTKHHNKLVAPQGIMKRRQQVRKTYKHDGSIIAANREKFLEAGDFYKMSITPYITNELDIDTQADFDYAEWRMR